MKTKFVKINKGKIHRSNIPQFGLGGAVQFGQQGMGIGSALGSFGGPLGGAIGGAAGLLGGGIYGWIAEDKQEKAQQEYFNKVKAEQDKALMQQEMAMDKSVYLSSNPMGSGNRLYAKGGKITKSDNTRYVKPVIPYGGKLQDNSYKLPKYTPSNQGYIGLTSRDLNNPDAFIPQLGMTVKEYTDTYDNAFIALAGMASLPSAAKGLYKGVKSLAKNVAREGKAFRLNHKKYLTPEEEDWFWKYSGDKINKATKDQPASSFTVGELMKKNNLTDEELNILDDALQKQIINKFGPADEGNNALYNYHPDGTVSLNDLGYLELDRHIAAKAMKDISKLSKGARDFHKLKVMKDLTYKAMKNAELATPPATNVNLEGSYSPYIIRKDNAVIYGPVIPNRANVGLNRIKGGDIRHDRLFYNGLFKPPIEGGVYKYTYGPQSNAMGGIITGNTLVPVKLDNNEIVYSADGSPAMVDSDGKETIKAGGTKIKGKKGKDKISALVEPNAVVISDDLGEVEKLEREFRMRPNINTISRYMNRAVRMGNNRKLSIGGFTPMFEWPGEAGPSRGPTKFGNFLRDKFSKENLPGTINTLGNAALGIGSIVANEIARKKLNDLEYPEFKYPTYKPINIDANRPMLNETLNKIDSSIANYNRDIDNRLSSSNVASAVRASGRANQLSSYSEAFGTYNTERARLENANTMARNQFASNKAIARQRHSLGQLGFDTSRINTNLGLTGANIQTAQGFLNNIAASESEKRTLNTISMTYFGKPMSELTAEELKQLAQMNLSEALNARKPVNE